MSKFDEREKSFEKKFANDQELQFKVAARSNKYLGEWVSSKLGKNEEEKKKYIQEIIKADMEEGKAVGVRSTNYNEADLITCLSNDFGYENWVSKAIEYYADSGDTIILISSSGTSQNIINGAKQAKKMSLPIITFSGFDKNNELRKLSNLSFWVDSNEYNIVEMAHHVWLVSIVDYIGELKLGKS